MCNAGACSDEHDQTIKSAALGGDHIVLCTQAGTVLSAGLDNFGQSSGRKTSNNFSIQRMHNRAATDLRPAICKRQAGRGRGLPLPGFVGRRPRLGLGRQHGRAGGRRRLVEVFGAVPCGGPGRPRGPPLGQRNARGHGAGGGARGRGGAPLCGRHGGRRAAVLGLQQARAVRLRPRDVGPGADAGRQPRGAVCCPRLGRSGAHRGLHGQRVRLLLGVEQQRPARVPGRRYRPHRLAAGSC
mmetsp:Transcript_21428/g.51113  ORF Transcript_21428/g.51113 Transcript_21428/m.51113 type:complete len:241 (+) Transcript_21428:742-1464(+)